MDLWEAESPEALVAHGGRLVTCGAQFLAAIQLQALRSEYQTGKKIRTNWNTGKRELLTTHAESLDK